MYKHMMLDVYQKTLSNQFSFEGIGLHNGENSNVTVKPSDADSGIVFKRVDIEKNNIIEADFKNVDSARLCTTLKNSHGIKIATVEHLMAAFYFTGVDNAIVEINNSEIPIMDGSAKDFVNLINKVGLKDLKEKRVYLKILKPLELLEGEKRISIEPTNLGMEVDFKLEYKNKLIGNQRNLVKFYEEDMTNIYSSRTFCLFEDIEKIKSFGLAKGGSLDNALVVKGNSVLNKNGLRNPKEFVNHKILDLAGDFLLSKYRILGKVKCIQGGHYLSNVFIKKLIQNDNCFVKSTLNSVKIIKKDYESPAQKLAVSA
mgnify:CR=1 FL=1